MASHMVFDVLRQDCCLVRSFNGRKACRASLVKQTSPGLLQNPLVAKEGWLVALEEIFRAEEDRFQALRAIHQVGQ